MAFFKFRFPGQAEQAATATDALPVGAGENIELVRRRARHRLIGAVVLVLGAVVVFPMLFDTEPRPVAVNTPIVITDRSSSPALEATGALPPTQQPAPALSPTPSPLPVSAGLDADEQTVAATRPDAPAAASVAATQTLPEPPAALPAPAPTRPPARSDKPTPVKPPAAPQVAKPQDDGSKARSLLDGQPVNASGRHVIQVGAFSDTTKVREVRQKLQQSGVSTYTQVISGNDGKSTTRVRVGPFDSREDAEKVASRIRKLGLSPAILKL